MQTLVLLVNVWPILSWSVTIIIITLPYTALSLSFHCCLGKRRSKNWYHHCIIKLRILQLWCHLAILQESALPSAAQGNHPVVQAANLGHMRMAVLLFTNSLCKTKTLQENMVAAKSMNKWWNFDFDVLWPLDSIHLGSNPTMLAWVPRCLQGCLIHLSQVCPNICTYGVALPKVSIAGPRSMRTNHIAQIYAS